MDKRLLVTVDVEALPARASDNHEEKLIWGHHPEGTAGIMEICDVLESYGGKALFFIEVAGSVGNLEAYREINRYLIDRGHCVEWHYHPEILGKAFWLERGVSGVTMRQDLFNAQDAAIILSFGLEQFTKITGKTPNAYRAGSFRWNQKTIDFLGLHQIPYSFNACAETSVNANYETFLPESPAPFIWPNGVHEIPCGEITINGELFHLSFPRRLKNRLKMENLAGLVAEQTDGLANILLHSWSFLYKNPDTGHFIYRDSKRIDEFDRFIRNTLKSSFELQSFHSMLEIGHMA